MSHIRWNTKLFKNLNLWVRTLKTEIQGTWQDGVKHYIAAIFTFQITVPDRSSISSSFTYWFTEQLMGQLITNLLLCMHLIQYEDEIARFDSLILNISFFFFFYCVVWKANTILRTPKHHRITWYSDRSFLKYISPGLRHVQHHSHTHIVHLILEKSSKVKLTAWILGFCRKAKGPKRREKNNAPARKSILQLHFHNSEGKQLQH